VRLYTLHLLTYLLTHLLRQKELRYKIKQKIRGLRGQTDRQTDINNQDYHLLGITQAR